MPLRSLTQHSRGVEAEGWVIRREGGKILPIDVETVKPRLMSANGVPVTGHVYRESGVGAIEFAGNPASTLEAAVDNVLQFMRRANEEGIEIRFSCKSPFDVAQSLTLETPKSRFKAIVEASQIETRRAGGNPDDWKALLLQNSYAATHLHVAFEGMRLDSGAVDHRLIFVANIINNFGPRIAKIICKKYGIDNAGHLAIFAKWAASVRFSGFGMWYRSFDDFKSQVSRMTRFIKHVSGTKEDGVWEADLETPLDWFADEDVTLLGMWHLCRLRKKYGTLEARILPSLPVEVLAPALRDLDDLITFLIDISREEDLWVQGPADFMSRTTWHEISSYNIGGFESLPALYDADAWWKDAST